MLADPITLNSVNFARASVDGDDSIYRVAGLTPPNVKVLSVNHSTQGTGSQVADRHVVRFDRTEPNAQGDLKTLSAYAVLVVPRDAVFDAADVTSIVDDLSDFFVEATHGPARLTKLLNGEA